MTKKAIFGFWVFLFTLSVSSCGNMNFGLPDGPQGPTGRSAYEVWVEQVNAGEINWPKDKIDVTDFLVYIKGQKGDKGENGKSSYELWKEMIADGKTPNPHNPKEMWPAERNTEADFWDFIIGRDGKTPHIGENGNWWIGSKDTGVYAYGTIGKDGKNGVSAYEIWKKEVLDGTIDWPKDKVELVDYFQYLKGKDGKDGRDGVTPHIGENGNWWFGDKDTGIPARGQDGKDGVAGTTPHIGENGNWWIGDKDTGIPAKGQDGKDGADGKDGISPEIGENGNWWFDGKDTGVPAAGQDGKDGIDGRSPRIGENGNWWFGDKDTGVPARGQDGKNGKDGLSPRIGENGNWWIGDVDTSIPARGKKGADGSDAKSAYELWFDDLKAGKIIDHKTGNPWPENEDTIADFWRYLRGAKGKKGDQGDDGKDGLSAYEIWKRDVLDGKIKNPNKPGENWPASEVSEHDFFRYLTGPNGKSGISAYKLWYDELKARAGTADPLRNHRTGEEWPEGDDTIDHFFEYLRGRDGDDGSDGKPGEPGQPGAIVKIIKGIPNVIAQYSQKDFGEYVRTEDGGVLYKVYDDNGNLAPFATVKGMPGLPADKTFQANDKGEFMIPREDLPLIPEVEKRWGYVKEVTIGGMTKQSATNTYVPNQMQMKLVLAESVAPHRPVIYDHVRLFFRILRQVDPGKQWEDLPNYLPKVTEIKFIPYPVTDHLDPVGTINKAIDMGNSTQGFRTDRIFEIRANRYIMPHHTGRKAGYATNWQPGQKDYFTVTQHTSYYGINVTWEGVAFMEPFQIGPTLKSLKLIKVQKDSNPNIPDLFLGVKGEWDYSKMDFTRMPEEVMLVGTLVGHGGKQLEYVYPKLYSKEEALKLTYGFAMATINIPGIGEVISRSDLNPSGPSTPGFFMNTVYLGSRITSRTRHWSRQGDYGVGIIRRNSDGTYRIDLENGHPPVSITYSETND